MYCGTTSLSPYVRDWDFRKKNQAIYLASDVVGSFLKTPFEVRKQLIQMYNHNVSIRDISYLTRVTCFPLICRDVIFRQMMLGVYYLTTSIEHKPMLKYSVPQITDFMK